MKKVVIPLNKRNSEYTAEQLIVVKAYRKAYNAKYRRENLEKVREAERRYNVANKKKRYAVNKLYATQHAEQLRAYQKQYREANAEKAVAENKRYRTERAKEIRAQRKAYRTQNAAKIACDQRAYRKKNRERLLLACKQWVVDNAARALGYRRRYYAENADRLKEVAKRYRSENPEKCSAWGSNKRARLKNSPGTHTAEDVKKIWERQGHKCAVPRCPNAISDKPRSKDKYQKDHIVPLSRGGSNDKSNLQILCRKHNQEKKAKDDIEWAQSMGLLFCK